MSLQNLKDAGSMLPDWFTAGLLNALFIGIYAFTVSTYQNKPSSVVAGACTIAILLSLGFGLGMLIKAITQAKAGEVGRVVMSTLTSVLNLTWASMCLSFVVYIGWNPASSFIGNHLATVISVALASLILFAGYMIVKPTKKSESARDSQETGLALSPSFKPTQTQTPTFQVTMADLTRLMAHQAGRAIGYTGSNILFDDTFSLELDVNERIARSYSNTNLINTSDFMYWRLHMLMMGSAAEQVLTGKSSQSALDDLTSFDDLAGKYLTLRPDRTFNAAPINIHEAQIKASRIAILRKNIYDRCHAACVENKEVLVALVKLMRTRSVLTYGDIRSYLDRVVMPEGFPVASFVDDEVLLQSLLSYEGESEVTLDGQTYASTPEESTAHSDECASGPEAVQDDDLDFLNADLKVRPAANDTASLTA